MKLALKISWNWFQSLYSRKSQRQKSEMERNILNIVRFDKIIFRNIVTFSFSQKVWESYRNNDYSLCLIYWTKYNFKIIWCQIFIYFDSRIIELLSGLQERSPKQSIPQHPTDSHSVHDSPRVRPGTKHSSKFFMRFQIAI